MTITVRAIYEHGVLRPVEPLALPEGEAVDVTIATTQAAMQPCERRLLTRKITRDASRPPSPWHEVYAIMATAPGLPEGYDLSHALSANRKATGERLPFPEPDDGSTP